MDTEPSFTGALTQALISHSPLFKLTELAAIRVAICCPVWRCLLPVNDRPRLKHQTGQQVNGHSWVALLPVKCFRCCLAVCLHLFSKLARLGSILSQKDNRSYNSWFPKVVA